MTNWGSMYSKYAEWDTKSWWQSNGSRKSMNDEATELQVDRWFGCHDHLPTKLDSQSDKYKSRYEWYFGFMISALTFPMNSLRSSSVPGYTCCRIGSVVSTPLPNIRMLCFPIRFPFGSAVLEVSVARYLEANSRLAFLRSEYSFWNESVYR